MRALEGVKVLDLSRYISGPFCAKLLGDLGADVIKVESPSGEFIRFGAPRYEDESLYFLLVNRNKKGITVNTRSPEGKKILKKLFQSVDIVVENFRVGVMEKMGFTWEYLHELNPRLILISISAYGDKGYMAKDPGYDLLLQAFSGLMDKTGAPDGPPFSAGAFVIDYGTATNAALGAVTSLLVRERTGKGQHVKLSLLQSALTYLHDSISEYHALGTWRSRIGNTDIYSSPVNCYQTLDNKWVCVIAGSDNFWQGCMQAIGKPDLIDQPRFKTGPQRKQCAEEIDGYMREWALKHTCDEIVNILREKAVPVAPVNNVPAIAKHEQVIANDLLVRVPVTDMPDIVQQGFIMDLSETPMQIYHGAPRVGEDNNEILQLLGYSLEEIEQLKKNGDI